MPQEILDDNLASTSSDDAALDGALDQNLENEGQVDGATGADSSDAQGDNTEGTLGIVRDVVKAAREGEASPAEGEENGTETAKEGGAKEPDDEDYSDVPFHKHPRFKHLLNAKKANEQDAGRYRNVQKFLDDNNVSAEESANALTVAAMIKRGDARGAWGVLKPIVQQLLVDAGEVLPEDLQKRVEAGEFTAEAASEIAIARATAASGEKGRSFEQQRQERQRQEALSTSLQDTAKDWCADRAKKDPNFEAKQELLMREIQRLQGAGWMPNTPEGVKEQLAAAYKAIPSPRAPKPGSTAPTVGQGAVRRISAGGSASGTSQPKPASTLDIIKNVVGQRGG